MYEEDEDLVAHFGQLALAKAVASGKSEEEAFQEWHEMPSTPKASHEQEESQPEYIRTAPRKTLVPVSRRNRPQEATPDQSTTVEASSEKSTTPRDNEAAGFAELPKDGAGDHVMEDSASCGIERRDFAAEQLGDTSDPVTSSETEIINEPGASSSPPSEFEAPRPESEKKLSRPVVLLPHAQRTSLRQQCLGMPQTLGLKANIQNFSLMGSIVGFQGDSWMRVGSWKEP